MRLFCLTVGKNEAQRYLISMLGNACDVFDAVFFYDDLSTDDTFEIAQAYNCVAQRRPLDVPSFVENEGAFRWGAWSAFEDRCAPRVEDWVLILDCDEVVVGWASGDAKQLRKALEHAATVAVPNRAIDLRIVEVFGVHRTGTPIVRTDRLWGTIHAPRFFPYRPNASFALGRMGVPAVPSYAMMQPWTTTENLSILHYGYADPEDRVAKYQRYTAVANGHSSAHVESILSDDPTFELWDGPVPPMVKATWLLP